MKELENIIKDAIEFAAYANLALFTLYFIASLKKDKPSEWGKKFDDDIKNKRLETFYGGQWAIFVLCLGWILIMSIAYLFFKAIGRA